MNLDILSKDKFHLEDGDIIEISVPKVEDDDRYVLLLLKCCVRLLAHFPS